MFSHSIHHIPASSTISSNPLRLRQASMPGVLPSSSEGASQIDSSLQEDAFFPRLWVPLFHENTVPTQFIHLPAAFVDMLSTGSIYLPDLPNASATTEVEWSDGTVDTVENPDRPIDATGVEAAIESAITDLGGAVCPKLGIVCPTDSVWANFHRSTKCTSADDVLTLLQASERVLGTLRPSTPVTLALRQWNDFDPRQQFRVFIYARSVVAIAHRAPGGASMAFSDDRADALVAIIASWFERIVHEDFQAADNYVIDVRVSRDDDVAIVDFGRWRETEPLLFDWDELQDAPWIHVTGRPQFRSAVRDGVVPAQSVYDALPVELRGEAGISELANAAQRFVREQQRTDAQTGTDGDE